MKNFIPWLVAIAILISYIALEKKARNAMIMDSADSFDAAFVPNIYCDNCPRQYWFERMNTVEWVSNFPAHRKNALLYLDVYHKSVYRDFLLKYDDLLWKMGIYRKQNPAVFGPPELILQWWQGRSDERIHFCQCWEYFYEYETENTPNSPFPLAYQAVCLQTDSIPTIPWLEKHLRIYEY